MDNDTKRFSGVGNERALTADPALYYRAHVFCCTNRRPAGHPRGCCAERGGEELRDHVKSQAKKLGLSDVRINMSGCLDRCELGPCIVIYPEGIWYGVRDKADIDEVLSVHLKQGGRVERLMLTPDQRPPKG